MPQPLSSRGQPGPWLRFFLRCPIALYRMRLGAVLGRRFVLLEHVGRTSGLWRKTVIEVVDEDRSSGRITIASGWGEASDWFKNITKTPSVYATIGSQRRPYRAERLAPEAAKERLTTYGSRHPRALAGLARLMLGTAPASTQETVNALSQTIPVFDLVVEGAS